MSLINNRLPVRPGFTIVELLIVVVIIAILSSIIIVSYNGIQARAHNARAVSMIKNYVSGFEQYKVLNGSYPMSEAPYQSYCLGVGYPNKSCGTTTYTGASCPLNGFVVESTESDLINDAIKVSLKAIPPAIIQPVFNVSTLYMGCDVVASFSGPTVNLSCLVEINSLNVINAPETAAPCANGGGKQAYFINYLVKGVGTPCGLSGSYVPPGVDPSIRAAGWESCIVTGGNVKRVP